eukprot:scaffold16024_cov258-Ochromonas_danica.AAC.9
MELNTSSFPKLKLKEFAKSQEGETSETKYWKAFSIIREHQFQSSPNCIHFNPEDPQSYLVTASVKVSLFDGATDKIQRSYSRFTDDAYSGKFRRDGRLIVAGEKTGIVKVFETQSKSLLRQLKRHNAATRSVCWSTDGLNILSASDDKHVLRWDLATGEAIWSAAKEHTDYVRGICNHPDSLDILATSSYDHTAKLWDSRQKSSIFTFDHSNPVECCMFAPSGGIVLTASGNEVKLWDVISGGRLLHTFNNHQKNVSGLCMDGGSSRLLSCGLDGHVKVYSLATLQVIHGMKFPSPILSVAMPSNNKKLVLGFVNGVLSVRNHKKELPVASEDDAVTADQPFYDASIFSIRKTRNYKGSGAVHDYKDQVVIETDRPAKLQPYETHLKKFNYQKALDAALKAKNPVIVITVLEELSRRDGLTIALTGRDETTLEPLLSFLARYVSHPRYTSLVVQVTHRVLDLYATAIGQSDMIDDLFEKLQKNIQAEVTFQRETTRVMGTLDAIINVATLPKKRKLDTLTSEELVPQNA